MEAAAAPLPYDSKIEYLEGDGLGYINTGIQTGGDIIVKMSLYKTSLNVGKWCFGGCSSIGSNMFGVYHRNTSFDIRFGYRNSYYIGPLYADLPDVVDIEVGNGIFKVAGTSVSYTLATFTGTYGIIIFGLNASTKYLSSVKIKSFYIKKGSLEMDMIPVRVGTVGYMYDRVSGQLFGNDGAGDFVLGPDIV